MTFSVTETSPVSRVRQIRQHSRHRIAQTAVGWALSREASYAESVARRSVGICHGRWLRRWRLADESFSSSGGAGRRRLGGHPLLLSSVHSPADRLGGRIISGSFPVLTAHRNDDDRQGICARRSVVRLRGADRTARATGPCSPGVVSALPCDHARRSATHAAMSFCLFPSSSLYTINVPRVR